MRYIKTLLRMCAVVALAGLALLALPLPTRPLKSRGKDVTDEAANHAMTGIQLARLRINAARVPSSVGIGGA